MLLRRCEAQETDDIKEAGENSANVWKREQGKTERSVLTIIRVWENERDFQELKGRPQDNQWRLRLLFIVVFALI